MIAVYAFFQCVEVFIHSKTFGYKLDIATIVVRNARTWTNFIQTKRNSI